MTQKTRRVFGFTFQTEGILAPGEPIKAKVTLPTGATYRDICVDGKGNFVLFAECWSHPEGTKVNHEEHIYLIVGQGHDIPAGWEYVRTIMTMAKVFHFFRKGTPKLEVAGGRSKKN